MSAICYDVRLDEVRFFIMTSEEIKALLEQRFADAELQVESDGYHAQVRIVSDEFSGLNQVKRQQMVYAVLNEKITDGSLHAVMMKLQTPDEVSI